MTSNPAGGSFAAFDLKRFALALGLALLAYWACLQFVFPGYFSPFDPLHSDYYLIPGITADGEPLAEKLHYPRPLGFLVLWTIGHLGLAGATTVIVAVTLINAALMVELWWRLAPFALSWWAVVLYLASLFAHPQFYLNHSHDTMATLSLAYLLLAMHCWLSWRQGGRRSWYVAALLLLFVLAFTKETYYPAALLFWLVQVFDVPGGRRRWAVGFFAGVVALELTAVAVNLNARNAFIQPSADPADPYFMSLAPASLAAAFGTLLSYLFTPAAALVTALSLLLALAHRTLRLPAAVFFVAGLSALLPHAVLPNHIAPEYGWVGAVLCLSPILLISRESLSAFLPTPTPQRLAAATAIAFATVGVISIAGWSLHRGPYEIHRWRTEQQQILGNIQRALPTLRAAPADAREILVTGLKSPFHPFYIEHYESYIAFEFGRERRWTVTMMRDAPRGGDDLVRRVGVEHVNLTNFDLAFTFDPDGRLLRKVSKQELQQAAASSGEAPLADRILIPELEASARRLENDPGDWEAHLEIGKAYWDWGWVEKARSHLEAARTLDAERNPYPFFFLGQIAEAEGNLVEAARLYRQAIEREDSPKPDFREALDRVD